MLSYQHSYHAGNFADVHKHAALCLLLRHLAEQSGPMAFFDGFAGRGVYDLTGKEAQKTAEYREGIARLVGRSENPPAYKPYLDAVEELNAKTGKAGLTRYPGSPLFMRRFLRSGDRLILLEMHPAEHAGLKSAFGRDKQVQIYSQDSHTALLSLLPPWEGQGLLLLDPSYEVKDEYQRMAKLVGKIHKKWPAGVLMLWYPVLAAGLHKEMVAALEAAKLTSTYLSEYVQPGKTEGMTGSGLFFVNLPDPLKTEIEALTSSARR